MARKKSQKQVEVEPLKETPQPEKSTFFVDKKWKILLFVFGFILYASTVNYDYALDDKIVITSNQITTSGLSSMFDHFFYDSMDGFWAQQYGVSVEDLKKSALVAGGRYRPLSLVTYNIEYGIFGEKPGLSHLINALLYGLTGLVLFSFLLKLLPPKAMSKIWQTVPFWATLLFLAHPLHVEVVANIKSRDEMLSLLFGLYALKYVIDFAQSQTTKDIAIAGGFLFLSLLSKETTIALVALAPLTLYFFNFGDAKVWKTSFGWLFASGLLYTVIRFMVIGSPGDPIAEELMNSPFLNASESERLATIFLILAAYVKLLFFPFPLTHDYYPYHLPFLPEEEHYATFASLGAIAGVIILGLLLVVIVRGFKSRSIYAYAALFFLGTTILVSNLFFPIGVFMNERFMYIPSVGVALALSYFLLEDLPKRIKSLQVSALMGFLTLVVILFSGITIARSAAWENDATLALTDVTVSTGSSKVNMSAADALLKTLEGETNQEVRTEIINESYAYLKKSLDIYPEYFPPLDLLGKLYYESGNYAEAVKFYGYCADRKPGNRSFPDNIFYIGNKLAQDLNYDQAILAYDKALTYYPNDTRYLLAAAEVFARYQNNPSRALIYMEKAYAQAPGNVEIGEKLGITYAMLSRFADAINILEPILVKNPQNSSVMNNLGIAYYQSGNMEKGTALMNQSATLSPK